DKTKTSEESNHNSQPVHSGSEASTVHDEGTSSENITYCVCQPSDQPEVILIADLRENNANFRGNTVVECLTKSSHRVEVRSLSVGDYVWVARKIDGTEIILDWVVERKTWSDLHQSIRSVWFKFCTKKCPEKMYRKE
ncbi:ERCC4 domain protein, partial [Cooperia oncophora]